MRFAIFLLAFSLLVACVAPVHADPSAPAEEKPWSMNLDGMRATYPEVEPNDTCPGQVMGLMDVIDPARIDAAGDNDWYQFTITTAPLVVTIGTDASPSCDPDAGDTYIYLLGPDCTTQLAADDDSGPGLYSMIAGYTITTPGTYHIRVRHYSSTGTGCYLLLLSMPLSPPNDRCALAYELARCGNHVINGDLSNATNDYNPGSPGPSCTGFSAAGKDLVYMMNLHAGDLVHLVYTTPNYDGSIYVVTDCEDVSGSCVVGEDDPEPETIDWTVPADGTYYFIADAYGLNTGGPFTLEISVSCPGACCFADCTCLILTEAECFGGGGVFYGPGTSCDPSPCSCPPGACCFPDGHCELLLPPTCDISGGEFLGFFVMCDPNPCVPQTGACCYPDCTCRVLMEAECTASGGYWQGAGTGCEPNPCDCPPPLGACCLADGTCLEMIEMNCSAFGGMWLGPATDCDPYPCGGTPTERTTWGQIKSRYR